MTTLINTYLVGMYERLTPVLQTVEGHVRLHTPQLIIPLTISYSTGYVEWASQTYGGKLWGMG